MSVANVPYGDDDFNLPAEGYTPSTATILPQPGNYRIKVTSLSRKKDENDQVLVDDKGFFTLRINRIEIVEPFEEGGSFSIFQELRTKPYPSQKTGKLASEAADALTSVDANAFTGLANFLEVGEELESRFKAGQEANVYIGYSGYDGKYVESVKRDGMTKEEINTMYKTARLNTKNFRNAQGVAQQSVVGPSGEVVQAKLKITSWTPSTENVKLGPTPTKGEK